MGRKDCVKVYTTFFCLMDKGDTLKIGGGIFLNGPATLPNSSSEAVNLEEL